jgi:ABC-type transporter Mla subunit MlaD
VPARSKRWTTLIPGLLVLTALAVGVVVVLAYARVGALHGDTYRLYTVTGEARGIMRGSEVWLAGQKVGVVADIDFRAVSADTMSRVRLALDILEPYRDQLRGDSYAQIRRGGTLLGSPVVYVVPGTPRAAVLATGSTIPGRGQVDAEAISSEIAIASRQFPEIIRNVKRINAELERVSGSVSGEDREAAITVGDVSGRAASLRRRLTNGSGSLAAALHADAALRQRAHRVVARADSLRAALGAGRGTVGRLAADSSALLRELSDLRNELSIVRALLAESRGTAGRLLHDSALVRQLGALERQIGATMEDVKRDPTRYIAF